MKKIALTSKIMFSLLTLSMVGHANDFYYEKGQKIEMTPIKIEIPMQSSQKEKQKARTTLRYYKNAKGHKVGVGDTILVQCHENIACKEVIKKYQPFSILGLSERIFLVKITNSQNIFKLSQQLYEDKDIAIAQPNFSKKRRRR